MVEIPRIKMIIFIHCTEKGNYKRLQVYLSPTFTDLVPSEEPQMSYNLLGIIDLNAVITLKSLPVNLILQIVAENG